MCNKTRCENTKTLWWTDIRALEPRFAELIVTLPPERRAKTERYRNQEDQLRSLAAGLLLRRAFGERAAEIRRTDAGKPFLINGPFFNLSHSGNRVVIAVDPFQSVGCDIQQREKISPSGIAKQLFHPNECALLQNAPSEEERQRLFYRLWTLKESYLKMTGSGFSLSPKRFWIDPTPPIRLQQSPNSGPLPFFCLSEDGRYTLAVCSPSEISEITPVQVDFFL